MYKAECPSCFFEFSVGDDAIEGEVVPCPDCNVDLEVVKLDKKKGTATLKEAEVTSEDWGE